MQLCGCSSIVAKAGIEQSSGIVRLILIVGSAGDDRPGAHLLGQGCASRHKISPTKSGRDGFAPIARSAARPGPRRRNPRITPTLCGSMPHSAARWRTMATPRAPSSIAWGSPANAGISTGSPPFRPRHDHVHLARMGIGHPHRAVAAPDRPVFENERGEAVTGQRLRYFRSAARIAPSATRSAPWRRR